MKTLILAFAALALVLPGSPVMAETKPVKKYQKCWCDFGAASSNRDCKNAKPTKCMDSSEDEFATIKDNRAKYLCSLNAKQICIDPMAGVMRGD